MAQAKSMVYLEPSEKAISPRSTPVIKKGFVGKFASNMSMVKPPSMKSLHAIKKN